MAASQVEKTLSEVASSLSEKYKAKTEVLGTDEADTAEVRLLNRVVQMGPEGVRLEADPRHAELVVWDFGLDNGREAAAPGDREFFKREA